MIPGRTIERQHLGAEYAPAVSEEIFGLLLPHIDHEYPGIRISKVGDIISLKGDVGSRTTPSSDPASDCKYDC